VLTIPSGSRCRHIVFALATLVIMVPMLGQSAQQPKRKVHFVPLGKFQSVDVKHLMIYYQNKFGLAIETLEKLEPEDKALDQNRKQYIAEELIALMQRGHSKLANDPSSILIGIIEKDMYIRQYNWRFSFGFRQNGRFAVVSAARMDPVNLGQPSNINLLHERLRKMITKNLGILYYRLPQNNNPDSVLYGRILGIDELDAAGEDF
jgi:predicted Zn-dependent protease